VAASILNDVKKMCNIAADDTSFDIDVIIHTNSAFSTLTQLGLGPESGFMIENSAATWDAFIGNNPKLNMVKSYVYLKVRTIFDPPQTSYQIEAMNKQIEELEVRLNIERESVQWMNPFDTAPTELPTILDGGAP
jgi:hypothetical protein